MGLKSGCPCTSRSYSRTKAANTLTCSSGRSVSFSHGSLEKNVFQLFLFSVLYMFLLLKICLIFRFKDCCVLCPKSVPSNNCTGADSIADRRPSGNGRSGRDGTGIRYVNCLPSPCSTTYSHSAIRRKTPRTLCLVYIRLKKESALHFLLMSWYFTLVGRGMPIIFCGAKEV